MPTSAPGSSAAPARTGSRRLTRALSRGFTMVELLIVIAIIAVAVALVSVALPDGEAARLDEEGERLAALLEMARAESRVTGMPVHWVPRAPGEGLVDTRGEPVHFRFVGLSAALAPHSRWLDERVSAEVVGRRSVVLGPSAILPPQRIVLTLADRRLELATDGLGPFAAVLPEAPDARGAAPAPR